MKEGKKTLYTSVSHWFVAFKKWKTKMQEVQQMQMFKNNLITY